MTMVSLRANQDLMSESEFLQGVIGNNDFAEAVHAMESSEVRFCLIGGMAVNQYAEPVVTLDTDFACDDPVAAGRALAAAGFQVEEFPHRINAQRQGSRLRVQISKSELYKDFPARAKGGMVFAVPVPVADVTDVLAGKIRALQEPTRRLSKKFKDQSDIVRLCENYPALIPFVPTGLVPGLESIQPKI